MRLALLGSDESIRTLLRDLPAEHELVAVYEAAETDLPLNALLPQVQRGEQWEALLVRNDLDAVIVAGPQALPMQDDGLDPQGRRVDQLKKLAQAGVSLLVSHPAAELLDAYEIEMLRREGGGCIVPWFPGVNHPAWEQLRSLPGSQITWERRLITRTRDNVLAALVRDLILIERIVGKLTRVTALGGPTSDDANAAWQSLTVQIESANQALVRWSMAGVNAGFAYRISIDGTDAVVLEAPQQHAEPWRLRKANNGKNTSEEIAGNDATATLAKLQQLKNDSSAAAESWLAACRSLEALAAIEKSLQRSRTIELSQAEQSEEHNFKGVMASGGCLLLMLSLFALFVVAMVEGLQLPLREMKIWRLWPIALIAPLAAFLAMQFLQTIIQKPPQR